MSIKVLHVIPSLGNGGAERVLMDLHRGLIGDKNFEQIVLTLSGDQFVVSDNDDLRMITLDPNKLLTFGFLKGLIGVVRFKPDVVVGWLYLGAAISFFLAPYGSKIIFAIHHSLADLSVESIKTRFLIRILKLLSRTKRVANLLFVSKKSRSDHITFGYPFEKSIFIRNGVSDEFKPRITSRNVDQYLTIGGFGRFHPVKDHNLLLAGCAELKRKGWSIRILLAGSGISENNRQLVQSIDEHGLDGNVQLMGKVSDIAALYQELDIYVLTSKNESAPNVILEALMSGVPVVSTDVGDAKEMVGQFGEVVSDRSPESLAAALESTILNLKNGKYEPHSMRAHTKQLHSISSMTEQYKALFRAGSVDG